MEFSVPVPALSKTSESETRPDLEHYDYPAQYVSEDKKTAEQTERLSEVRLKEFQTARMLWSGRSNCRRFTAGRTFTYDPEMLFFHAQREHEYDAETDQKTYFLTKVRTSASWMSGLAASGATEVGYSSPRPA